MSSFYVYAHIRKDSGRIFYIGKGSGDRAYRKNRKNPHWHNIVNKHGYEILILAKNLSEEQAFKRERMSIFANRFFGEKLVNTTDGGEGKSGCSPSANTRKKDFRSE